MLRELDIVLPTHLEWSAPTAWVLKRDGSNRLVFDSQKSNAPTVKTSRYLHRFSDMLNILEESHFFSSLDLGSGFHQMETEEDDKHLTPLLTLFG